jgi:hypothetical protein
MLDTMQCDQVLMAFLIHPRLFRYLANCLTLLTPRMAYEYKWNCSANLCGGIDHNIPNDNLVELLVQAVKKRCMPKVQMHPMTVKKAALTLQILPGI